MRLLESFLFRRLGCASLRTNKKYWKLEIQTSAFSRNINSVSPRLTVEWAGEQRLFFYNVCIYYSVPDAEERWIVWRRKGIIISCAQKYKDMCKERIRFLLKGANIRLWSVMSIDTFDMAVCCVNKMRRPENRALLIGRGVDIHIRLKM